MNALNQIAAHLEIDTNKIKRCEEWDRVWFIVIQGKGGRFVSKNVVQEVETKRSEFEEIFGGRIEDGTEQGRWLIYDCRRSGQTIAKFIQRAKSAGFRSAFYRSDRVGVLLSDVA
jgi:hypothetical protein